MSEQAVFVFHSENFGATCRMKCVKGACELFEIIFLLKTAGLCVVLWIGTMSRTFCLVSEGYEGNEIMNADHIKPYDNRCRADV